METTAWPPVAVMGAGAVGCYFGGMLARAGASVTLISRPTHADAWRRRGLVLEIGGTRHQVSVTAATDAHGVAGARVVFLCVKTLDTEVAARAMAPHLADDAIVVSLQNGVDNVERIRSAANIDAIGAAVYVSAEMTGPGQVTHAGRGDLRLGSPGRLAGGASSDRRPAEVAALFTLAGVQCEVSNDIEADLWSKLIMNCAYNAISALSRARYGQIDSHPLTRETVRLVVEEGANVARAAGIAVPAAGLIEAAGKLGRAIPEAMSSTAQDIARGKRTEIDALNGYIARRGAGLGIPTPVNSTLYSLVKLLEERGNA